MSDSQEQSLDENIVFLPVTESSPEFLHCEKERQAVERLLIEGPEAFYSSVGTERSGCFLSSEEVSQITSWAQDYHSSLKHLQRPENGENGRADETDFCSTYFPLHSETPAPELELGWPERYGWMPQGSITVHTSPPAEGQPPVREVIRRHLQMASRVIAIVTDRLTDGAIIGDLHNAATRGVPVYIILNQRSIQENFTLNRLRHPNMQVRVLGGKSFCSRTGRMVVGELKDKFILVDLETAIHGSYSLTWTDAHLHRQLITVLCGPVVDSFDREFRILFAASLPVSDTWKVVGTHVDSTHPLKDFSNHGIQKHLSLENEINNPPSPPPDSLLDWEAMGLFPRETTFPDSPCDNHEELLAKEIPLENMFAQNKPIVDGFSNDGNQYMERKRSMDSLENHRHLDRLEDTVAKDILLENNKNRIKPIMDGPTKNENPCLERKRSVDSFQNHRVSRDTSPVTNHVSDKSTPFRHFDQNEDTVAKDIQLENNKNRNHNNKLIADGLTKTENHFLERKMSMDSLQNQRVSRDASPVTNHVPDKSASFRLSNSTSRVRNHVLDKSTPTRDADYLHSKTELSPTDLRTPDIMKRVERETEKGVSRQLSSEKNHKFRERTRIDDKEAEPAQDMVKPSSIKRRERLRRDSTLEEKDTKSERPKVENTPSSRKPLILVVPQSESFSSLSDIMKRIQLRENSSGQPRKQPNGATSEISRSMMDLSVPSADTNDEEKGALVPRFKAGCFDPGQMPGASLRNRWSEDMKPLLYRNPKNFMPRERPRSSSYALNMDWRRSLAELRAERELEARK